MTDDAERAELIAWAERLESLAERVGTDDEHPSRGELEAQIAAFNARLRSQMDARAFRQLHAGRSPDELIDDLLAAREAPPLPSDLAELMTRARAEGEEGNAGFEAAQRLEALSRLPGGLARELGAGEGEVSVLPVADVISFAELYVPPTDEAAMRALAIEVMRAQRAVAVTPLKVVGLQLLIDEHHRCPSELLAPFVKSLRARPREKWAPILVRLAEVLELPGG